MAGENITGDPGGQEGRRGRRSGRRSGRSTGGRTGSTGAKRPTAGTRKGRGWGLAAVSVLALAVVAIGWELAGAGREGAEGPVEADPVALIAQARHALDARDGVAAEMKLRAALEAGATRRDVAAWMGEAYLDQDNPQAARSWLGQGAFSPSSAALGWRALARVDRLDGRLEAATKALDTALRITPADPVLWVEVGRLRYARGQHLAALEAAERALALGPDNVRALQFKGQLVRDRYGLAGALPWFDKAMTIDQDDVPVLLDYAATLGDLGHARDAVTLTRHVLDLDPGNPEALYLQAVIAARAGNFELTRELLERTKGRLDTLPAVLELRGIAELVSGNLETASDAFEGVLKMRPDSRRAQDLLARAIYLSGQYRYLTLRFGREIARGNASPYLLTLVARAHEVLGEREQAGGLLDAAARTREGALHVIGRQGRIGQMLAGGQAVAAEPVAKAALEANPGFYDAASLAGDVQLVLGQPARAQALYAQAARIRMSPRLFQRRYAAFVMAGDRQGAQGLVQGYLDQNPQDPTVLRVAARQAMAIGDFVWARAILKWLRANGGARDVQLLCDLARVELRLGDTTAALDAARDAYRLQRSSALATQVLGLALAASGQDPQGAGALFAKAEAMVGTTGTIARGRALLQAPASGNPPGR